MFLYWKRASAPAAEPSPDGGYRWHECYTLLVMASERQPGVKTPRTRTVAYLGRVNPARLRYGRSRLSFWSRTERYLWRAVYRGALTQEQADAFKREIEIAVPPWDGDYFAKTPPLVLPQSVRAREAKRAQAEDANYRRMYHEEPDLLRAYFPEIFARLAAEDAAAQAS
jgi:hypothetical protein